MIRLEIGALAAWTPAKQRRSNHTRQNIIRRFLSKKKLQSLPLPRNGPSGKKPQSCTMKRTDRNIWKCRSGIPDIIMISTAWLQHRSKKLLFQAGSPEESCRFQNEILSQIMGEVPGGCAGHIKITPAGIPVRSIGSGL